MWLFFCHCDSSLGTYVYDSDINNFCYSLFDFSFTGPMYIRDGLKFNITYLGHPCSFTIKKIYGCSTAKIGHQESMLDICSNMSSLNITGDNSILDDSISGTSSPLCSTPIAKSSSSNIINLSRFERNDVSQFYSVHSKTKIIIDKLKEHQSCSNKILFSHLGGLDKQISILKAVVQSLINEGRYNKKK